MLSKPINAMAVFLLAFMSAFAAAPVYAENIEGVYNTGPSDVDEDDNSSLNLRFHPCESDEALTCATIVEAIEPDGPSGRDTMPDGSPVIGFQMIKNLEHRGEGEYRDGKINAIDESLDKGKMVWYGLKVTDNQDGTLTAKGCLAFICPRTMTWTVVTEPRAE